MPTYEYECQKCGFCFEAEQSIKSVPLEECSQCHGRVKRLISAGGGFLLKGARGEANCDAHSCSLARSGRGCPLPSAGEFS
ncbi:MAG: zinc ribbon domain-containing protein [Deltaproteobacteria bacterium]|nr:zinc ribbon domain-containing protein [Deltaproteobacteria bacterium]